MKNKKTRIHVKWKCCYLKAILPLVLSFTLASVTAQVAIPVSGGNAFGGQGSLSYTIGQPVYTAVSGDSGILSQGVQQSYVTSVVSGIGDLPDIRLAVSAYPNPAVDYLTLSFDAGFNEFPGVHYKLMDSNGRLLLDRKITDSETSIAMGSLVPAMYFLKVISENREIKTFKIIKK